MRRSALTVLAVLLASVPGIASPQRSVVLAAPTIEAPLNAAVYQAAPSAFLGEAASPAAALDERALAAPAAAPTIVERPRLSLVQGGSGSDLSRRIAGRMAGISRALQGPSAGRQAPLAVVVRQASAAEKSRLTPALYRIDGGRRYHWSNDGAIFQNDEGLLPDQSYGYYREYVVPTRGVRGAGAQRVVMGEDGDAYYTPDHYRTFRQLR